MTLRSVYFTIEGKDGIFTVEKKASMHLSCVDPMYIQSEVKGIIEAFKKDISAFAKKGRMTVNLFGYDENYHAVDGFRYCYDWSEVTFREWNANQGCYVETLSTKYLKKDNGVDFAKLSREITKAMEADTMKFIRKHGKVDYEYAK